MPDDVTNLKITLERIHVINDEDWFGSGELYFEGEVEGVPFTRSPTFDADSGTDINLTGPAWQKVIDVRGKASIHLALRGVDEDLFFDDSLGTVRATIAKNGAGEWPDGRFSQTSSDPADFTLHYKVEPILALDPARPETAVVCRVVGGSSICSTISGVPVRVRKIKATVPSTPPRTPRAAPPAVANAWAAPVDLTYESTKPLRRGPLTFAAADFTMPDALVLIRTDDFTIQLEAETDPPGVDVFFSAARATDDAVAIGAAADLPTVTNTGNATATMAADQRGSFFVLAFLDVNRNRRRDNDEIGIILPVVLVDCSVPAGGNRSTANAGNYQLNFDNVLNRFSTANFTFVRVTSGNFASPATAGMSFNSDVLLVGGGADGLRGVDRVFLGWANTIELLVHEGTYSDGSVVRLVVADNVPGAGVFLPPAVPNLIPPYWLDTGRFLANGSAAAFHSRLGGENILFTSSNMGANVAQALGTLRTVTALDSPGLPVNRRHPDPAKPGARLRHVTQRIFMTTRLVAWTNTTGGAPPTPGTLNSVGFRTFAVVATVAWSQEGEWRILSPTAANPNFRRQIVNPPGEFLMMFFAIQHSPPVKPSVADQEVRPPSALEFLGRDAQ